MSFFRNVTMALPSVLMDMQRRGILVDKKILASGIVEYNQRVRAISDKLKGMGVDDPGSNPKLASILFDAYNLRPLKRSKKTGKPSVDEDVLLKLKTQAFLESESNILSKKAYDTITEILNYREQNKILTTYLRGLPIFDDGRVHCNWLVHGTITGRLSCRNPNLQNVPEGIARRIYCAAPGYVFVSFDYSQIELRLIAYISDDLPLIEAFEQGRDPHSENAALLFFQKDVILFEKPNWITKDQRKFTKSFIYAYNYGGDIVSVLEVNPGVLSIAAGKYAQAIYLKKHPALPLYRSNIKEQVTKYKKLTNIFGRERICFGATSDILKSAYDWPMQSGAADVINKAAIRLRAKGLDSGLLLQIHDQLLFELKNDSALPQRIADIKAEMEPPVEIKGRVVRLPVEVSTGANWDELKEYKAA